MKKLLLAIILFVSFNTSFAQQYALFGTKTMFDAFENPSQKSFTLDSSRKFSSNFFLPYFGVNGANKGSAESVIRRLMVDGVNDNRDLPIGTGEINHFYQNSNIYVLTLRLFHSYKYQKEMGFAWQIRSDSQIDYTNESLIIFDSAPRFPDNRLDDIFNTKGYQQSYHQFSFTYRENYNKRLAFGVKASVLSGIVYNDLNISDSYLDKDPSTGSLDIGLTGTYASNFNDQNKINRNTVIPNFKNPGVSVGFSTNYTTKKGLFLMANIKDLGFIWWRSNTTQSTLSIPSTINTSNQGNTNRQIRDIFESSEQPKKFLAATNAKADVYISKNFDFYKPAIAISKNLFYKGGDIAFINTFKYNDFSGSVTPLYNLNNIFMVGLQGKYQTPNFEIFMGTDNLISSANSARAILKNDYTIGSGPNGASFYMGIGIKFGNVVNHPQFSDVMPGINDNGGGSFFKNLFSLFKKN
ncbi:DUF5723 family protein [Pedobacter jejuensis]|uniref:DUF5723 domain-containing protein n=1 Tax=Pedobacter jejuensis TaxID=1268550 RepID=A0A3N0C268_9SPHI|nr:DUF5723 family protein [Pedobacter jejuensis]RNL56516.1 hypothetical protein D7004_01095 [Pedobacter jejuensis]